MDGRKTERLDDKSSLNFSLSHDNCYGGWCNDVSRIFKETNAKLLNTRNTFTQSDLTFFEEKSSFIPYTIHNQGLIDNNKNNPVDKDKITAVMPTDQLKRDTMSIKGN